MSAQERREVVIATIANGASLSNAIDLTERGRILLGIDMPAAWTTANITFAVSMDGVTYKPFRSDQAAAEYQIPVAAGVFVGLEIRYFFAVRYFKLRSGTSGAPVAQNAEREITLVTVY